MPLILLTAVVTAPPCTVFASVKADLAVDIIVSLVAESLYFWSVRTAEKQETEGGKECGFNSRLMLPFGKLWRISVIKSENAFFTHGSKRTDLVKLYKTSRPTGNST